MNRRFRRARRALIVYGKIYSMTLIALTLWAAAGFFITQLSRDNWKDIERLGLF